MPRKVFAQKQKSNENRFPAFFFGESFAGIFAAFATFGIFGNISRNVWEHSGEVININCKKIFMIIDVIMIYMLCTPRVFT